MEPMDDTKTPAAKRTIHTSDFKKRNATALALELGVPRNQLYKWAKRLEEAGTDKAFKGPGRPAGVEEDELAKLRRENERLKLENTILKKAEAYFARRKP
ncbi:hypothetical protein LTR94_027799 [Friedmanniomyces endolithicus]|nr:hypothetical protein LTR94_027799 [Friedmanniomyces endolithicus]